MAKPWDNFELVPLEESKPGKSLFNFQQWALYQSLNSSRYILGTPTGTGKSLCSIASYLYYKKIYPQTKLIVVTSNSSLFQFAGEFEKFFNFEGNIQVITDKLKFLQEKNLKKIRGLVIEDWGRACRDTPEVLIMNYPIFRIEHLQILKAIKALRKQGFHAFLVLDEATAFKNPKALTTKAVRLVQKQCDKVLGLTATLTRGRLVEIYEIFKGIGVELCPTKAYFEQEFCDIWVNPRFLRMRKLLGYKNLDQFRDLVIPHATILCKSDIADSLPRFTYSKVLLEHSPDQYNLIRDIYSGLLDLKPGELDFGEDPDRHREVTPLTEVGYIKRALIDPGIVRDQYTQDSPKTEELLRMLEDDFVEEKIVVYTPSKKYLHKLRDRINGNKSLPEQYRKTLEICGDISPEDRFKNVELFTNSPLHNIMIIDDAGGEAINLQAASVLILMSMPKNFGFLVQIAGRISRLSSTYKNLYLLYFLIQDSMDEIEYRILMQQGLVFQTIHGEVEEGLLDVECLKQGTDLGISREDFINRSVQYLLLMKRESLKVQYTRNKKI